MLVMLMLFDIVDAFAEDKDKDEEEEEEEEEERTMRISDKVKCVRVTCE